jgi:hypothetical protein
LDIRVSFPLLSINYRACHPASSGTISETFVDGADFYMSEAAGCGMLVAHIAMNIDCAKECA